MQGNKDPPMNEQTPMYKDHWYQPSHPANVL